MKTCTKCKIEKLEEVFAFKNKAKGTRNSICKECHKAYRVENYTLNKQKQIQQVKSRRIKLRTWLHELKEQLCCARCGFSEPAALQFHHQNKETKTLPVAIAVLHGWSKESIQEEISKCIVLCANCHAIEHWK